MNHKGVRLVNKVERVTDSDFINVIVNFDGTIECDGYNLSDEDKLISLRAAKKYMLNEKALTGVMEANKAFWDTIES